MTSVFSDFWKCSWSVVSTESALPEDQRSQRFRFLQLLQWKMTYLKCSQVHISLKYFNDFLTVYVFLVNLCVSQCFVSLCQQRRSWRAFRQKNMNRDFKKWLLTWCWWGPGLCVCVCVCVHVYVYVCGVKRVLLSHPVGSLKVFARRNTWQPSGACFSLWYPSHTNFDMQITHTHSLSHWDVVGMRCGSFCWFE